MSPFLTQHSMTIEVAVEEIRPDVAQIHSSEDPPECGVAHVQRVVPS